MLKKSKGILSSVTFTKVRKWLGSLLIIASLCSLLAIYLPVLRSYLPYYPPQEIPSSKSQITIPKIGARAPLVDDVDPWDENEYRPALTQGVALAKGFSKPGQPGTSFVFAHSSDSPWRITSYNTVFFRLGELKEGDLIEVRYGGQDFKYRVSYTLEVWPDEVEALTQNKGDQLILQTCTPAGTSLKRLLVFADLT